MTAVVLVRTVKQRVALIIGFRCFAFPHGSETIDQPVVAAGSLIELQVTLCMHGPYRGLRHLRLLLKAFENDLAYAFAAFEHGVSTLQVRGIDRSVVLGNCRLQDAAVH